MWLLIIFCCSVGIAAPLHPSQQKTLIPNIQLTPKEKLIRYYYRLKLQKDINHAIADELLYKALSSADLKKVQILWGEGVDLNTYDKYDDFPLLLLPSFASKYPQNKESLLKILYFFITVPTINLDLSTKNNKNTTVMDCVWHEQYDMLQILLEAGASWSLRDSKQRTAAEMYCGWGKPTIMRHIHTIKSLIIKDIEHHIAKTDPARTQVAQPLSQIIVEYL